VFSSKVRDKDVGYEAGAQYLKCRMGTLADLVGVGSKKRDGRNKE
jgi:hypothetical protein